MGSLHFEVHPLPAMVVARWIHLRRWLLLPFSQERSLDHGLHLLYFCTSAEHPDFLGAKLNLALESNGSDGNFILQLATSAYPPIRSTSSLNISLQCFDPLGPPKNPWRNWWDCLIGLHKSFYWCAVGSRSFTGICFIFLLVTTASIRVTGNTWLTAWMTICNLSANLRDRHPHWEHSTGCSTSSCLLQSWPFPNLFVWTSDLVTTSWPILHQTKFKCGLSPDFEDVCSLASISFLD